MYLYARYEPTTDTVKGKRDVVLYKDDTLQTPYARFPWNYQTKPRRNTRQVTVNCVVYSLVWMRGKEK